MQTDFLRRIDNCNTSLSPHKKHQWKEIGLEKAIEKDFITETSKKVEFHFYHGEVPCSILQTRNAFCPYVNTFEETCTLKVT